MRGQRTAVHGAQPLVDPPMGKSRSSTAAATGAEAMSAVTRCSSPAPAAGSKLAGERKTPTSGTTHPGARLPNRSSHETTRHATARPARASVRGISTTGQRAIAAPRDGPGTGGPVCSLGAPAARLRGEREMTPPRPAAWRERIAPSAWSAAEGGGDHGVEGAPGGGGQHVSHLVDEDDDLPSTVDRRVGVCAVPGKSPSWPHIGPQVAPPIRLLRIRPSP
jgi:hypothetical protein